MAANQRELKPFANMPGVSSLGDELRPEPLEERKYPFANRVDIHYFRKINDKFHFGLGSRDKRANLFRSLTRKSAFEPADQSTI
jgi:hypothetical protein